MRGTVGGGTLMWSVAVHWICTFWDFLGGASQGQPLLVFCAGSLCQSNLRWPLLVLGLEIFRGSQAVNLSWLLLVPGVVHLARGTRAGGSLGLAFACLGGFRKL